LDLRLERESMLLVGGFAGTGGCGISGIVGWEGRIRGAGGYPCAFVLVNCCSDTGYGLCSILDIIKKRLAHK
jgi:hypothetical protein